VRPAFLLDAHLSPVVARLLGRQGFDARAVGGSPLMDADDDALLQAALDQGRLFITYDTATVPRAAADRLERGLDVPGIVYVSSATLPSNDFAGLARALGRLAGRIASGDVDPSGGLFLSR